MQTPRRRIELADLLDDIEGSGRKIVFLMIDHDGTCDIYDPEDVEFVGSELFERVVVEYEIKEYTKRKVGVHLVLD